MSHIEKEDHQRSSFMAEGNGAPLMPSMTLSADQFEKLYLDSKREVAGDLRKTFANPTPLAVMGFSVALLPLSIEFMGWRGSGGAGIATITTSIWFGGVSLLIAGLLEFLLGNTFPFIVFMGYGAHFLTIATVNIPWFNAQAGLNSTGATAGSPIFYASFGFYPISLCLLSFIFLLCSFRTNLIFVIVFLVATAGFGTAAGAYFHFAVGSSVVGGKLLVATGALFFVAAVLGWYLLAAILLQTMDLPSLPVFDLSTKIKGVSERKALKESRHTE